MKKLWVKVSGGRSGSKNGSKNNNNMQLHVPAHVPAPSSSSQSSSLGGTSPSPITPLSPPSVSSDFYPYSEYSEAYSGTDSSLRHGSAGGQSEWYPLSDFRKMDSALRSISVNAPSEWYSTPDLRSMDSPRRPKLPLLSPVSPISPQTASTEHYHQSNYKRNHDGGNYRYIPGSPSPLSPVTPLSPASESEVYPISDYRKGDEEFGRHGLPPQFYMVPIPEHQPIQSSTGGNGGGLGSSSQLWL